MKNRINILLLTSALLPNITQAGWKEVFDAAFGMHSQDETPNMITTSTHVYYVPTEDTTKNTPNTSTPISIPATQQVATYPRKDTLKPTSSLLDGITLSIDANSKKLALKAKKDFFKNFNTLSDSEIIIFINAFFEKIEMTFLAHTVLSNDQKYYAFTFAQKWLVKKFQKNTFQKKAAEIYNARLLKHAITAPQKHIDLPAEDIPTTTTTKILQPQPAPQKFSYRNVLSNEESQCIITLYNETNVHALITSGIEFIPLFLSNLIRHGFYSPEADTFITSRYEINTSSSVLEHFPKLHAAINASTITINNHGECHIQKMPINECKNLNENELELFITHHFVWTYKKLKAYAKHYGIDLKEKSFGEKLRKELEKGVKDYFSNHLPIEKQCIIENSYKEFKKIFGDELPKTFSGIGW